MREQMEEAIGDILAPAIDRRAPYAKHMISKIVDTLAPEMPTHRHYKGGLYRELMRGTLEATMEPVVIYRDAKGAVWVRPAKEFDGTVSVLYSGPGPNLGVAVRRFQPLAEEVHSVSRA